MVVHQLSPDLLISLDTLLGLAIPKSLKIQKHVSYQSHPLMIWVWFLWKVIIWIYSNITGFKDIYPSAFEHIPHVLNDFLSHWGQVTHICLGKLTIICSDNGLLPGRCQAIIWTNAGILLIRSLGTNLSEIFIGNQVFSFKKMHLKMSSMKLHPFCPGLNVLKWASPTIVGCSIEDGYYCVGSKQVRFINTSKSIQCCDFTIVFSIIHKLCSQKHRLFQDYPLLNVKWEWKCQRGIAHSTSALSLQFLTHQGWVTHISVSKTDHHLFRWRLVAYLAASHVPN